MATLNNIMANGNNGWFSSTGRTNCDWQSSTLTPGDGAKTSVKILPKGEGECSISSVPHSLKSNHKYYLSLKMRFNSSANGTIDWYWPIAEPAAVSHLPVKGEANQWVRCSATFTREMFSDGNYPCRFDYNNETINIPFYFTCALSIADISFIVPSA